MKIANILKAFIQNAQKRGMDLSGNKEMKRSIFGRLFETLLLICAWPIALTFSFCYLTTSLSLGIASKIIDVWGKND